MSIKFHGGNDYSDQSFSGGEGGVTMTHVKVTWVITILSLYV